MKNNIKLVVLDFDDTLCMNRAACYQLENKIAQKMGFPAIDQAIHKATWGQSLDIAVEQRVPGIDKEKYLSLLMEELPIMAANNEVDYVTEENLAVLDAIKGMGKRLAILTSRTEGESVHLKSEKHPLSLRLEKFYCQRAGAFHKPDKRAFLEILNDFEVNPAEALYVGDSLGDAECAKGAGLTFIATLESGLRSPEDFAPFNIDAYIYKLSEMLAYL